MEENQILVVNNTEISKINTTQIVTAIVMLGAYFGLPISAEFMNALLIVIAVLGQVATYIFRKYWTGRAPTVKEIKIAAKVEDLVVVPEIDVKPSALASATTI